jgi:4-amino-4-deoxy-L-arabinose transferase-like glycosyltransferase
MSARGWQAERRMPSIGPRLTIGLLGVVALAARAAAVAATPDYRPQHDDHSYLMHALALAQDHAYPVFHAGGRLVPTAYRAPGFPVMLAVAHRGLDGTLAADRVAQVLAGAAIPLLVWWVGRQIWGPRTALAAGLLAAVSPVLVLFDASLISEPLFTALLLGALGCALHAHNRAGWAVAAGALAGAAALTRPEGLAVAVAVALCAGGRRAAVAVLAATVLCVAPWTVRNALTLHAFVPVSTATGNTLAGTYNTRSLGDGLWRDPRAFHIYRAVRRAHRGDEAATDHALTRAVMRFVADHPTAPLRVAALNAPRLAGVAPIAFSQRSLGSVSLPLGSAGLLRAALILTTLLGLAGACTAAARRAPPGWWMIAALVAAVGILVNAEQRFAVPLQPFLLLLAPLPFTRGR